MSITVKVKPTGVRRLIFPTMVVFFCLLLLALIYVAISVSRGLSIYSAIKERHYGDIGNLYEKNLRLGYAPKPGAYALSLLPIGSPIPTHHDMEGLRAPSGVDSSLSGARPRILFLGCSFTYGHFVSAEKTFAYQSANDLGGNSLNAGVNGYSLAQMVLRGRELIPKYKPDFVVVQYSPWLVERAMKEFAPTYYEELISPIPYYSGQDELQISPPPFELAITSIPEIFYQTAPSLSSKLSFLTQIALPTLIYNDYQLLIHRSKQILNLTPTPSINSEGIIRHAYAELNSSAKTNGAIMIILALGSSDPIKVPGHLFPPGTAGVNGPIILAEALEKKTPEAFRREYMHWRGTPLVLVDNHPNERAHALLGKSIAERIRMFR